MLYIKILGPGCANCSKLVQLCREVVVENNIEATLEKITDREKFLEYGVVLTPALIVNGKLMCSGKIPLKHTLAHWLKDIDESEFTIEEKNKEE